MRERLSKREERGDPAEEEEEEGEGGEERTLGVFIVVFSMSMAWSYFFCLRWLIDHCKWSSDTVTLALVLAVIMTLICLPMIIVLDALADAKWTAKIIDRVIKQIITANGLLVGFSWEQSFDLS